MSFNCAFRIMFMYKSFETFLNFQYTLFNYLLENNYFSYEVGKISWNDK